MRLVFKLSEPAAITALQILSHLTAALAGLLVVFNAFPYLFRGVDPVLAFGVGLVLAVGGAIGAGACIRGVWWLERVALMLVGLGWVLLVPSVLAVPIFPMIKAFILLLLAVAFFDVCKRYRRIDWAYLDPTK
jgi:hypothetical protein